MNSLDAATLQAIWNLAGIVTPIMAGAIGAHLHRQNKRIDALQEKADRVLSECNAARQVQHEETIQRISHLEASHAALTGIVGRIEAKLDHVIMQS